MPGFVRKESFLTKTYECAAFSFLLLCSFGKGMHALLNERFCSHLWQKDYFACSAAFHDVIECLRDVFEGIGFGDVWLDFAVDEPCH